MVGVALVDLGWWARKMSALIKKVAGNLAHSRGGAERRRQGRRPPVRLPVTADRETTLDDPKVDAVILATRTASMASMVRQSVAARKHVFCERPLALTRKEGVAAVDLCKSASLVFGMGHERRFEPTIAGKTVYPITGDQLVQNISLLESIVQSASSGRVESVA
jgi:predicted dehydrogenase